ncbi:MAG: DUF1826 domain-containing protein [Bacteroidota bacterium]
MVQPIISYPNAAISHDARILQDIHLAHKNIAIYQRNIGALRLELEQVVDQEVNFKASGSIAEILNQLSTYAGSHLGSCPSLLVDVAEQLGVFQEITQVSSFRVFFATISNNMCRKFHTDVNDLRLLCSYVGPGTLWLPDEAIDHEASRDCGPREEVVIYDHLIQQAGTGEVVLLKGALYPGAHPILHRSPTIEEHGERRLLLRIDTNESVFGG